MKVWAETLAEKKAGEPPEVIKKAIIAKIAVFVFLLFILKMI